MNEMLQKRKKEKVKNEQYNIITFENLNNHIAKTLLQNPS